MAASMALQIIPVVRKDIEIFYRLHFDYTKLNEIMRVVKQRNARIISQDILQSFPEIVLALPLKVAEITINDLRDIQGLELKKAEVSN